MVEGMTMRSRLPLKGIRVLDLTQYAAGALASKVLADHGAEVILVESEPHIRSVVGGRQPAAGARDSTSLNVGPMFNKFNTSKMSITLNLDHPEGLRIVKRLIALCDVVMDNFRPHVMERWGLTYEELVKTKPDIIVLTMPTMGRSGPRRHFGGVSWGINAMAGLNQISGYPERMPISASPYSHPDVSSNPFHAATALLAALHYRNRTGRGQLIELSQYESTLCFTGTSILDYTTNGRIQGRCANRSGYAAPHGVYPCKGKDRWSAIAVFTDAEWHSFCCVTGMESLTEDVRFATLAARLQNNEELDRLVEAWTREREAWEVMQRLQEAGVAAGVVGDLEDLLFHDAQLRERGHWVVLEHPELGRVTNEKPSFQLSETPGRPAWHAPLLGQHNDLVFQEILGMSEEEVNVLIVEGVIQ